MTNQSVPEAPPRDRVQATEARKQGMSTEKLDEMVLDILEKAGKQMTIREIERRVADRGVEPSTLDIQKSARRLVAAQRAELTPDLYIKARR